MPSRTTFAKGAVMSEGKFQEQIEKMAPAYTGETCSSTRRNAYIDGALATARMLMESGAVREMREALIRARKEHDWDECDDTIAAGKLIDSALAAFDSLRAEIGEWDL